MLYVKQKDLKRQFGVTDVEHLALAMYKTFHNNTDDMPGWTPYKKWKCDPVVQEFRMAALIACEDVEFSGLGAVYKDVV